MEMRCRVCEGSGFVKQMVKGYCLNNPYKLSSHTCYLCENIKAKLKGAWKLCDNCHGDGTICQKKQTQEILLYASS